MMARVEEPEVLLMPSR